MRGILPIPLHDLLDRSAWRRLAAAALVGGVGLAFVGVRVGFEDGGWRGALRGGFVGGAMGGAVGASLVEAVYLILRLAARLLGPGGLDGPIRRPDRWASPRFCSACGWRTWPGGTYTVRECLLPVPDCPACGGLLTPIDPRCPRCGENRPRAIRKSRSVLPASWTHKSCCTCGAEFDRWGRPVWPIDDEVAGA